MPPTYSSSLSIMGIWLAWSPCRHTVERSFSALWHSAFQWLHEIFKSEVPEHDIVVHLCPFHSQQRDTHLLCRDSAKNYRPSWKFPVYRSGGALRGQECLRPHIGVNLTRYEIRLSPNCKVTKLSGLANYIEGHEPTHICRLGGLTQYQRRNSHYF